MGGSGVLQEQRWGDIWGGGGVWGGGVRGGGWVCRFTRGVGGRIVARMTKCVDQFLPVSFTKCMKYPCGEGTGLVHCGNDKLDIFHYQPFICCENSATFSIVIAPRGEKLRWEVSVSTSEKNPNKSELTYSNLVSYSWYVIAFLTD